MKYFSTTFVLFLFQIWRQIHAGKVSAFGATPIVLSSTNAGDIADYNFTMVLDTPLPASGTIEITFPLSQYVPGLGLPYIFTVYANYPNNITAVLDSATAKTIICSPGAVQAGVPLTIGILKVKNPLKVGGTGNFKAVTKLGNKVLDINYNFGSIGIYPAATNLYSASIDFQSGYSKQAGQYSNYVLSLVPSIQLTSLIDVKVEFPDVYSFSSFQTYQCTGSAPGYSLNLYCSFIPELPNVLIFSGFSSSDGIAQGVTISLVVTNILNPPREMTTETLRYFVREVGTNNTIQKFEGVPGLVIQPGVVYSVSLSSRYASYPLYTGLYRSMQLTFRPSNPCRLIQISTSFPLISSCSVIGGLSQLDTVTRITCYASSHVMTISNFALYSPDDLYLKVITVIFDALMPSLPLLTNTVEVYTYLDYAFLLPVDEDTNSASSQVQVYNLTTRRAHLSTRFNFTTNALAALNNYNLSLIPGANVTYTMTSFIMEFTPDFIGIPYCYFSVPNSNVQNLISCTLTDGVLTATVGYPVEQSTAVLAGTYPPARIYIYGIYNPSIPTTYNLNYYMLNSGNITDVGQVSISLQSLTIPTFNIYTPYLTASAQTPFYITFTAPLLLADGYFTTQEPAKSSAYIDIGFKMTNFPSPWFAYDMGTGQPNGAVDCEIYGILMSPFASSFECILIQGPSTGATNSDYVYIRLANYGPILAGTQVSINLAGTFCQTAPDACQATIRMLLDYDYTLYTLATGSFTFPATTTTTGTSITGSSTLTNQSVQAYANWTITFTTTIAISVANNNSILLDYPTGYNFDPVTSVITLDGNPTDTHQFNQMGFFTIQLSTPLAAGAHSLRISNLKTPNSSLVASGVAVLSTLDGDIREVLTITMPTLTPGSFLAGSISYKISPNTYSCPFANYRFNFTTTAFSDAGTKIVVTFPAAYSLSNINYCYYLIGLTDISFKKSVTCTCSGTTVTLTNYQALNPGVNVSFTVMGVENPASAITGQTFLIEIVDSSNGVIETTTITAIASDLGPSTYSPIDLNIQNMELNPLNPLIQGWFTITMMPSLSLPKQSVFSFQFDPTVGTLYSYQPNAVECYVSGGLNLLSVCSVSSYTLTVQFGNFTDPDLPIVLTFYGLISFPDPNTALTGWVASLDYNSVTVANAGTFPSLITAGSATTISQISMHYNPQNEAEIADYTFTFNLSTPQINSSMHFLVRFPFDYDPDLKKYNLSVSSNELQGALKLSVQHRQVMINGFYDMDVEGLISITVSGVVNPNKVDITSTGKFGLALMYGPIVLEGNFAINGIVPLLAPDSIQLISIASSIKYCRYNNDYTISFLPRQNVLASSLGGQIAIQFPPDYIIDSFSGSCSINQEFSFFVNCYIENNRVYVNASNPSWDPDVDGELTLKISSIINPDLAGNTLEFIIFNLDLTKQAVIGRTFSNLNPSSIYFPYDGLQISVNQDLPVQIEVGTYSDPIFITMPGVSKQSLTLTPNVLDSNILITPFPLQIELGQTTVSFRVAAPRDILLKSFYITWSKTGDALNPTYAPLRRTELVMRSKYVNRTVLIEQMEYIPIDGISYPLFVYTNNPPYEELVINLAILGNNSHANLSDYTLTFIGGSFNVNYSVFIDALHPLSPVSIYFSISGKDGDSYILPNNTLSIPIVPKETFLPVISSGAVLSFDRSSAKITINGNTLAFIYYMIADKNVIPPIYEDVKYGILNETAQYSNPKFGVNYIKTTTRNVTFTVAGLDPLRSYDFYAYIVNLNQINNPDSFSLNFTTKAPQKIAEFVMAVKQNSLSEEQKSEIFSKIAAMISIPKVRLLEKTTDCVQSQDNLYYNTPNTTYLHIFVLPDITSENDLNTPLSLVENLNQRRDEIQVFVPRLADGDLLQIQELPDDIPAFKSRPLFVRATTDTIFFEGSFTKCGYAYAIAVPVPNSRNMTESGLTIYAYEQPAVDFALSYEIYSGLNLTNQPAIYSSFRINDYSQTYTMNVTGLNDKTIYEIYVTAENDWPNYNLRMSDERVARLELKTLKRRKPLNIFSINAKSSSNHMVISILLFLTLMIFIA